LLNALISWIKKGLSSCAAYNQLEKIGNMLADVENYIAKSIDGNNLLLDVRKFSIQCMAEKIHSVLLDRVYTTFPEKYRWRDD